MKEKLSGILLTFFGLFASGQVTLAVSEIRDAKVNQQFNLTVLLEISGENMQQETPLRMPDLSRFDVVGSASEQNTIVVDARKGDVINQMAYQWVLVPRQPGKVKFGSVLVTVNGKIYKTEPFEINVRESERKSSVAVADENVYLNLELQNPAVYPNQPTVAILRASSKNFGNLRKLKHIQLPQQKNIRINSISFAKSEIESRGGAASQVIAAFMIFPSESGNLNINPASAEITGSENEKIISNRAKLHVKKLPSGMPSSFKNAVGKFEMAVNAEKTESPAEVEKPLNIKLSISGKGNLNTLELPKILPSEQYQAYPPKIATEAISAANTLSGEITAEYIIIPKTRGNIPVMFEGFSYFDPQLQQYVDLGSPHTVLAVKTADEIAADRSQIEKINALANTVLETVNTPVLQTENLKITNEKTVDWKVVAGNLMLLSGVVAAFALLRHRRRKRTILSEGAQPVTTVAQTEEKLRERWDPHFEDHLVYLRKLENEQQYDQFFTAYDNLKADTFRHLSLAGEAHFKDWLVQNGGAQLLENYRTVTEQMQVEKFAPFHTPEAMSNLSSAVDDVFREIIKLSV